MFPLAVTSEHRGSNQQSSVREQSGRTARVIEAWSEGQLKHRRRRPAHSLKVNIEIVKKRFNHTGGMVASFWRRDGQELHEQVDPGEVLPNHDGTFQVSVDLDLTAVPQEDWGRYECVVQLKGIEDISTPLDPALIRTNGVFVYQKRNGE
ncbi:unnamed protein product [Boreogadus saida]